MNILPDSEHTKESVSCFETEELLLLKCEQ